MTSEWQKHDAGQPERGKQRYVKGLSQIMDNTEKYLLSTAVFMICMDEQMGDKVTCILNFIVAERDFNPGSYKVTKDDLRF